MAFQRVINHVFLPRVLLEEENRLDDSFLIQKLKEAVCSISDEFVPPPVKKLLENMHRSCVEGHEATIYDQLSGFGQTDLLGFYVRAQNCGLLLRGLPNGRATFASFQTQVPNEILYDANVHNDIQVNIYLQVF